MNNNTYIKETIDEVSKDRFGGPSFYPTAWRLDRLYIYSVRLFSVYTQLNLRKVGARCVDNISPLSVEEEDLFHNVKSYWLDVNLMRIRYCVTDCPRDFADTIKSFIIKPGSGGCGFFLKHLRDALSQVLTIADDEDGVRCGLLMMMKQHSVNFAAAIDLLRRHAMNKEADIYEGLIKRVEAFVL